MADNFHSDSKSRGRALVLGLGATGLSLIEYLARHGYDIAAADSRRPAPMTGDVRKRFPAAAIYEGPFDLDLLHDINLLAVSPGVSINESVVQHAIQSGIDVAGDIELFARELNRSPDSASVLSVTGSNGKSTVTALTASMLTAVKKHAVIGGNFGTPVLTLPAAARTDAYVLELSSFQLETIDSLRSDCAALLNISEDHLDRHLTLADYAKAKARIFANARHAVINRDDPLLASLLPEGIDHTTFGAGLPPRATDFGLVRYNDRLWIVRGKQTLVAADALSVTGFHNYLNVMAALALVSVLDVDIEAAATSLGDFTALPHRMEVVAEHGGVRWINDSKATNVAATCAALSGSSATGSTLLIAGGQGKDQNFTPFAEAAVAAARAVILFGEDAPAIEASLRAAAKRQQQSVAVQRVADLADAIERAQASASPGDDVLFSPACASFDMFANFEERGRRFSLMVRRQLGLAEKPC